jgi:sugar-specific transcriptional regulator TrmB
MQTDVNTLMSLDFSENDARVYLCLAELKNATANPIIQNTGLHRALVYTSLEHLVARKLISSAEIKGKKHFSITSPDFLVQEFEEKQEKAKNMVNLIKSKINSESQEITLHQGNDEYLKLLTTLINELPSGSTKYVLGTGGKIFMEKTMNSIWKKYHAVVNNRKVRIHMIAYNSQKPDLEPSLSKMNVYTTKYLSDDSENPAGIHIYPEINTVLNIIYSDELNPVTAIRIKNKALTESYLKLFKNLWIQGK